MNELSDRTRAIIFILLMLVVSGAAIAAIVGVAWFLRPDPFFARAGMEVDFPAQSAPHYVEMSRIHLFIFADGEGYQILDATVPGERRGNDLAWDDAAGEFYDPQSGARFAADGTPMTDPSQEGMTAYPAYAQDGELWVDMRQE